MNAMSISIPQIGDITDVIFIIGSNTTEAHPLIARQILKAKERGAKLIVADPRMTDIAEKADLWIRCPLGYDTPLVNGMLHVVVKENLHKPDFIAAHVAGFDDVARAVASYSPEAVEKMSRIPADQIVQAARMYALAKTSAILWTMGVAQFSHGVGNVVSLANLALACGQIGRPGAGVCPLRGQNNVEGAGDMGALPNFILKGIHSVTDPDARARMEKLWGVKLRGDVGLHATEVPHAINAGKLKTLFVFGENPLMSDPDSGKLREEIQKLDLVISTDMFMNETARYAHYVLPAAGWPEKDGTFTNTERRVQRVRAAVAPPGEARPDWTIFRDLAARLGYSGMNYQSAEEIWDEVRRAAPSKYAGITYARLDLLPGILWPCPSEDHPGTEYLYEGGVFAKPDGKAQMRPVLFDPHTIPDGQALGFKDAISGHIYEHVDDEYPFMMTTGRKVMHYHTGTMTRKSHLLEQLAPEEKIEINPGDAARLSVREGDYIRVQTRRGFIVARAWVTQRVAPGNLFSTFHYWEACCNELTNAEALDPISRIPPLKMSAARVTKVTNLAEAQEWRDRMGAAYRRDVEKAGAGTLGARGTPGTRDPGAN
jgi:formate dehydrogenase major subunit